MDYDSSDALTQAFFGTVQNKIHYAVHGQTAAGLIAARADSNQPNMGLTNWQGARIRKPDVSVAKNQAEQAFDRFKAVDELRFESDFDQVLRQLPARPSGGLR